MCYVMSFGEEEEKVLFPNSFQKMMVMKEYFLVMKWFLSVKRKKK